MEFFDGLLQRCSDCFQLVNLIFELSFLVGKSCLIVAELFLQILVLVLETSDFAFKSKFIIQSLILDFFKFFRQRIALVGSSNTRGFGGL